MLKERESQETKDDLQQQHPAGLAGEVDSLLLPYHQVARTPPVNNTRRY